MYFLGCKPEMQMMYAGSKLGVVNEGGYTKVHSIIYMYVWMYECMDKDWETHVQSVLVNIVHVSPTDYKYIMRNETRELVFPSISTLDIHTWSI